jgi:hypothetical protein
VTLNPGGAIKDVSFQGTYFRVISATNGGFQMSFDGSTFFPFEKGLGFGPLTEDFTKLWFKSLDTAFLPNTVTFLYGNVSVQDSRTNIIAESDLATLFYKDYPFIVVPFQPALNGVWVVGETRQSDGILPANAGYNFLPYPIFRRSIEWSATNFTSDQTVKGAASANFNGAFGLSIKDNPGLNILTKTALGFADKLFTFPTLSGNIIDAKPLTIKNEGANDLHVFINETYWLDGQYQYP